MTVYWDVYAIKNIFFNGMLLYITSFLIRKKTKWYRIALASIFGCAYALIALYDKNIFNSSILKIMVGIIMLLIAFGKKEINYSICTLLIITYWIAGIIASILQVKGQIIMIAIACFSYILYFLYSKIEEKQKYYEIAVGFLGEEIPLKAKLDTGNELKDGLFGEPVIVISEEKAKDELSSELIRIMKNERLEIPHQYQNRIKLISFKTISGEDIKIGIKLDYVIISKEDKKIENKAIMILTEQKLNGYDTLIGSNLLEGAYVF